MKKLAAILCLSALATGAFAQGLIKFANSATSLISVNGAVMPQSSGTPGYYFALLSAPLGTVDPTAFVFSGLYASNTTASTGGRLQGGSLLGVTANSTWPAATSRSFEIVGWDAGSGASYNPAWLTDAASRPAFFGMSAIAGGQSGGTDPVTQQTYPALALFSGLTLASGFNIVSVPEPTTMALAGLGAAALMIFRRRK